MTRRRKMFALLGALGVVAVIIFVVTRPRGAEVELKFVGWETNGAAVFQFQNHSSQALDVFVMERGMPLWLRTSPMVFELGAPSNGVVRARTTATYRVMLPRAGVWRAKIQYYRVPDWWGQLRDKLQERRLLPSTPFKIETRVSEVITNAPPVP
jgi:hypothetical protein